MATIVVQDDKILRFIEVILDPDVSAARIEAFRDYLVFDEPDVGGWFDGLRRRAAAARRRCAWSKTRRRCGRSCRWPTPW